MSEIKDSLKKIVMAGFGAVSTGIEKSQELLDQLAEKGKDSYEQAAEITRSAKEKLKQAFDGADIGVSKEDILAVLGGMPLDALKEIRGSLDGLIAQLEKDAEKQEEPCCEKDDPCCCKDEPDCCKDEPCTAGDEAPADEQPKEE